MSLPECYNYVLSELMYIIMIIQKSACGLALPMEHINSAYSIGVEGNVVCFAF